jgi:hypothetical protein
MLAHVLLRQAALIFAAGHSKGANARDDAGRIADLHIGAGACRKLNPGILVMQFAQGWATKNMPGAIDGARDRCIFLQG